MARVTDDPAVLFNEPRGTILPTGGVDAGHKGYALALIVEMLTGGLAGFGRADAKEGWGATVFVQAIDPVALGGLDAFARQAEWIAQACRDNPPRAGVAAVRLPGDAALRADAIKSRTVSSCKRTSCLRSNRGQNDSRCRCRDH